MSTTPTSANSVRWYPQTVQLTAIATASICRLQREAVTLAMTYVRNDEVDADAVKYVLNLVKNYSFEIEPLLADSGFYNERVIRHSREISPTIIQVPKKVERIKEELGVHKSCMTIYRMYKDPERDYVSRSLSLSPTKTVIYVLLNPQKTSDRVALYYVQKHC